MNYTFGEAINIKKCIEFSIDKKKKSLGEYMNTKKDFELWVLSSIKNNGTSFVEIKKNVEKEIEKSINKENLMDIISDLEKNRFLTVKNNKVYPKYEFEVILGEIAALVLEKFGPLQIRDLSKFISKHIAEDKSIRDIEAIIKEYRYIEIYNPTYTGGKGISKIYYPRGKGQEKINQAIKIYKNPDKRYDLRKKLGILSDEQKKTHEEIKDKQVKERDSCSISELFDYITNSDHINGEIKQSIELEEKEARYDDNFDLLNEKIWEYLKEEKNIDKLYTHQASAINALYNNKNPFITTSNASGKTFTYVLPIIDTLIDNPNKKFLYISPTKSLAQDQKNTFNELGKEIIDKEIAKNYDGHTSEEDRKRILKNFPNVILTNEHMLHYNILYNHEKWHTFFKDLEYIIIDESHWYKGVFGSHVSNLFRRLNIISSYHGAYPQYICLSATIGNANTFAEDLISKEVVVIDNDGSPSWKKTLALFESGEEEEGSIFTDICYIIAEHVASQFMTLAFGKSRNMVESMTKVTREKLEPMMRKKIESYRAGIPRKKRREIEELIFNGTLKGIISTSAMELGIDIGNLDSVILAGYPGSLGSFWQRANRAGRSNIESDVFFAAMNNPLDQYFLRNPEELLSNNFENAIINPENEKIKEQHSVCLRSEINSKYLRKFKNGYEIDNYTNLDNFIDSTLKLPPTKNERAGVSINEHEKISLRGVDNKPVAIEYRGEKIGETNTLRAPKEVYPGAIYMVHGEKYEVKSYDGSRAIVEKHPHDESTYPVTKKSISIENSEKSKELQGRDIILGKGKLKVDEYYIKYFRKNKHGDIINTCPLNFNPNTMNVDGLWFVFSQNYINEHTHIDFNYALHGLTHTLINLSPIQALCDISDISGSHHMKHENLRNNPGLFLYETNEYGVGLLENIYENMINLLEKSHKLLSTCDCENGCPNCIQHSSCPMDNNDLDKQDTIMLIEDILSTFEGIKEKDIMDIRDYIGEEESKHLEYKETFLFDTYQKKANKKLKSATVKEICAFANSDGGRLVIGVDDKYHDVTGLERDFELMNKGKDEFELQLNREITNKLGKVFAANHVDINFHEIEGNIICIIEVSPSEKPVFFDNDDFYVRIGSSSMPLDKKEMNEYIEEHFQ